MVRNIILLAGLLTFGGITGCGPDRPLIVFVPAQTSAGSARPSPGPDAPTVTPIVARVNGEPILLMELQERVQQFEEAEHSKNTLVPLEQEPSPTAQAQQWALDGLIDQKIIAQAARTQGIIISDDRLNRKIAEMKQGQTEAEFQRWLALNNFTDNDLRETLRSQLAAAELFAVIVSNAPTSVEQIHARHMLLPDLPAAQSALARLQTGESFAALAQELSQDEATRINGGDLGWFPRGAQLLPPEVEEAAFALPPGQTGIIQSALGYHLLKVTGKDQNRPLTPEYRQLLQVNLFNQWFAGQRASAKIEHYSN